MKKAYLLVGSIGLLGAIAQVVPSLAAKDPSSVQDGEETTTSSLKALPIIGGVETAALPDIESAASRPASVVAPMAQHESILQNQLSTFDNLVAQGGTVTSVSQLSDVQPSDWAFQALRLLIERHGCITGYADRTYQGDRALTRYEFAAGTYACLNNLAARVGQLHLPYSWVHVF